MSTWHSTAKRARGRKIALLDPRTSPDLNFDCDDSEFNDYYRVNCYSDIKEGMNRTWVYMVDGAVVGYISVAMGYMRPGRDPALRGMGYGNVPALLVGYLATDKRHVRQGVASGLLSWAVREAIKASKRVGCRILMLNPTDDPAVKRFYRNRGFRYVPASDGEADAFYIDIQGKIKADTRPTPGGGGPAACASDPPPDAPAS